MNREIIDKTIKSLEASVARFPDNPKLMTSLAEMYLKCDILGQRTLKLLEKLSEMNPQNHRIHRALSICYLIQQPTELASTLRDLDAVDSQALIETGNRLDALKTQHGHSADLYKAMGDISLFLKEPDKAVTSYKEAIKLGFKDFAQIIKSFTLAYRSFELPHSALMFFASIYDRIGLPEKAANLYRKVILDGNIEPEATNWLVNYLEGIVNADTDLDVPLDNKIELIDLYLKMEKIEDALRVAHSLNMAELDDYAIIKKLARILIDLEDYRQSFDFLSRIPLDAENKALINEITLRLERHGELDTAVYLLQFINTHDLVIMEAKEREDKELKINTELGLAELHYKNKKWDSALEKYISILKIGYEDWDSIIQRVDHILKQIKKPPLSPFLLLADICIGRRQDEKAASYLSSALQHYPGHTETQQKLRTLYDRILTSNPRLPDIRLSSGDLAMKMDDTERAIADYERAASYPEISFTAGKRLARAFEKAGDYQMALDKYQTLGEITPDDCQDLFNLYEKLTERGMIREALDALKLIQEYDPEYQEVGLLIDELEQKAENQGQSMYIDPKMRELIGDHAIGRYKYVSKIGSGGMGVVHKVFDIKNNCIVAMKILREGLSGSSKAIDRFFREARIAATLNHKNIVRIYDYNISNVYGQSFITMSFVDGESLRDIIERRFSESLDISNSEVAESLYYISQLCEALECTHDHGIIHRDIKPDNIMIDRGRQVKITDFGIIHVEEASFTPTGALIGTPRYMSPEQVRGGKIDCRSDIYASGIIMYELLVGSPPFISGDIAYQQVNIDPTPPGEICPTIPTSINDIILKCLMKNPDDRYQKAPNLKNDIDRALKDLGGYEPPPMEERPKTPKPQNPESNSDIDFNITE